MMAVKIESYLSSGVSVLLVMTTGTVVPFKVPEETIWAK